MIGLNILSGSKPNVKYVVTSQQELDAAFNNHPVDGTYKMVIYSDRLVPLDISIPPNHTRLIHLTLVDVNIMSINTRGNKFEVSIENCDINCNITHYRKLYVLQCKFNNQQTRIKSSQSLYINYCSFVKSNSLLCLQGRNMTDDVDIDRTTADDYVTIYAERFRQVLLGRDNEVNCLTTKDVKYVVASVPYIFITGKTPSAVYTDNIPNVTIVNAGNVSMKVRLSNIPVNILSDVEFEWHTPSIYSSSPKTYTLLPMPSGDKWFNRSYFLSIGKIIDDNHHIMLTKEQCEIVINNEEWIRSLFNHVRTASHYSATDTVLVLAYYFLFHQLPAEYAKRIIIIARECGIHPVIWVYEQLDDTLVNGYLPDRKKATSIYLHEILKQLPELVFSLTNGVVTKVNHDETYEINPNLEIIATNQLAMAAKYITEKTTIVYNANYALPRKFSDTNKKLIDIVFKWAVTGRYHEGCDLCVQTYYRWQLTQSNFIVDPYLFYEATNLLNNYQFREMLTSEYWSKILTPQSILNLNLLDYGTFNHSNTDTMKEVLKKTSEFIESNGYNQEYSFSSRILAYADGPTVHHILIIFMNYLANNRNKPNSESKTIKMLTQHKDEVIKILNTYTELIPSLSDYVLRAYNKAIYNQSEIDEASELLQIYAPYLTSVRNKSSKWNSVQMMLAELQLGDITYNSLQQKYKIDNLSELDEYLFSEEVGGREQYVRDVTLVGVSLNKQGKPNEICMTTKNSSLDTGRRNPLYFNSVIHMELLIRSDTCIIAEISYNVFDKYTMLGYYENVDSNKYILADNIETVKEISSELYGRAQKAQREKSLIFYRLCSIMILELYNNMDKYGIKKIAVSCSTDDSNNRIGLYDTYDFASIDLPEYFKQVFKQEELMVSILNKNYMKGVVWILEK